MVIPKPAALLKGLAGYKIQRTSYLSSGYICEYTQSITRGTAVCSAWSFPTAKAPKEGCWIFKGAEMCKKLEKLLPEPLAAPE